MGLATAVTSAQHEPSQRILGIVARDVIRLAQSGKRTVCGMLTGAGLSRIWPHDRAHYFFSRARWNPDELGITAAKLVIGLLVPDGEPVEVLIDDTVFRTMIPRDVHVSESPSHGLSVLDYSPRARGAWAYAELAMEVIERE